MKFLSIIMVVLSFCSYANAETWSTTFSGSLSKNATRYHYFVFPAAGTATISCSKTYSGSTGFVLVGYLQHSGQSVTLGSAPFTVSNQAVWPDETYAVYMMCPHGDGGYYGSVGLSYTLNTPPVISSLTVTPSSPVYGDPVTVNANVADAEENLSYVQFQNGGVVVADDSLPYSHVYNGLVAGTYTIIAYAVDAEAESDDDSVQFTIAKRPITVKALSGSSVYGDTPVDPGLQLVSGDLVYDDTLSSIGLCNSFGIAATTHVGSYVMSVSNSPANYSVSRQAGTYTVTKRPINLKAKSGSSIQGTAPNGALLEIVSGSLVNDDSFQSIGLTISPEITSSTLPGTYTVKVLGAPADYSVSSVSGTWIVLINMTGDTDGDGVYDRTEMLLYGDLTTIVSFDQLCFDSDNDLYGCLVKAMGGVETGTFESGVDWSTESAPGAALPQGLVLVRSNGACLSVDSNSLTLNQINW